MSKPVTMLQPTALVKELEWIKEPETVDDCVLRMDQLQEAPDIEYAHMEADRLLLKALSILARSEADKEDVNNLYNSFSNLRKLYA